MTTTTEREVQSDGSLIPPSPPQRTAVATDDPEKPPCRWCGHTLTEHLRPGTCDGKPAKPTDPVICRCTRYAPKTVRPKGRD